MADEDEKPISIWKSRKGGVSLQTPKQIRRAVGDVLRGMGRGDVPPAVGSKMIWGLQRLHAMILDEKRADAPAASPTTLIDNRTYMVAGEVPAAVRRAQELFGGPQPVAALPAIDAECDEVRPVVPDPGGVQPD